MNERTAAIIIDTGFSLESLQSAEKIIAVLDVRTGSIVTGLPYLTWKHHSDALQAFAGDPLNHGSMVLQALMNESPNLPVILVRAYNNNGMMRTTWNNGKILNPGWTEAYLTAVHICRTFGLNSVANLSFGGYTHAADGTGWESHCLATVTGQGKSGHVVVAGAGTGTGASIHSSWRTDAGQTTEVHAQQKSTATYNFWCAAEETDPQYNDWLYELFLDGNKLTEEYGANLIPNLWNNRKQVTFHVPGAGHVMIRTTRFGKQSDQLLTAPGRIKSIIPDGASPNFASPFHCAKSPLLSLIRSADTNRFDCWINQLECDATFLDHKDAMLIAEPAIFPHVFSVGLLKGEYSIDQHRLAAKPDLLIEGDGPISFRLPEITAEIASMLSEDPTMDVSAVRAQLWKTKAA